MTKTNAIIRNEAAKKRDFGEDAMLAQNIRENSQANLLTRNRDGCLFAE
jgi:hypothetical protein